MWMRALLRLYPHEFREQFGHDMRLTFAARFRECATASARVSLIARSLADAVHSGAAEWRDALSPFPTPTRMLSDTLHAFRHATRTLRRNPGFTAATVLTLAVGIGATTAVFSVMGAALFKPLPYPNADRLVAVGETTKGEDMSISYPDLLDFQSRARSFQSIAGFAGQTFTLSDGGEPERFRGQLVTANLFATLGVHPLLGHAFSADDDRANAAPVVAISHALWTRRFAADSAIIGRTIAFDGRPFTVTAVMPPEFHFPDGIVYGPSDVWAPMSLLGTADRETRDSHPGLEAVGALKPGISLASARTDLSGVAASLAHEYPVTNQNTGVRVTSAIDAIVGSISSALLLLMGAAGVVLLIACANVAGLLLTRAESRRREMAIKIALGAGGMRVAANFAGEAALLAIGGGLAGTALAFGLVKGFGFAVVNLPRLGSLTVDLHALEFAAGVTTFVAFACGLAPMLWARRHNTQQSLTTRGAAGTLATRMRNAFVVGQVALSLVLLVTASLLLRTFDNMSASDGGVRPAGVFTFAIQLPDTRYRDEHARAVFMQTFTERLSSGADVSSAAAVSVLPFSGFGAQARMNVAGRPNEEARRTDVAAVTPGYFRTMGIEVVHGRDFAPSDNERAIPVVVVDERFAEAMWPGEDAVGKRVTGWAKPEWTVVGVVRHVKNYGVSSESRQEMYAPYAQRPTARVWTVVRTNAPPGTVMSAARAAVKEIDPLLPVYAARSMREVVDATVAGPRLAAFLSAGYALTALLVVIIGLHGALAYVVHRRTREIGVRMALGATAHGVIRLVVAQSLKLTGIGVVIGGLGAFAAARLIREQLFGVTATDLATFGGAALGMLVVGVIAGAVPAWRAARVSPATVLGEEG
jgi:predicted permease